MVIKAVDADRVLIGDPASGVRAQRRAAFEAAWSGVVFAIHDTAQPVRYDDPAEWRQTARLPVEVVERPGALSDLLLGLAYPAQVSTNFSLNQYINSP